MKKFMTFVLSLAMVSSVCGVTAMAEEAATTAPAPVAKKTAVLSNAKVAVNGTAIAPQAYTIDGYTFFKLRDVANALIGTEAGFGVTWNPDAHRTVLTTGAAYTAAAQTDAAAADKAIATLSADAVQVNGEEVVLEAYNINGYNYYKLRELGEALGFEITWDAEAKMIGIHTAKEEVIERTKATEFTFALAEDEERIVENLIFDEDVTISGNFGSIIFENCVFNGDIINTAELFTKVILPEGTTVNGNCVFQNATKEANMDYPMPKFVSPNPLSVVCEDCIGSFVLDGTEGNITFNGETYTMDDVESFYDADTNALVPYEGQEVSEIFVGQWWENGEKVLQLFCE